MYQCFGKGDNALLGPLLNISDLRGTNKKIKFFKRKKKLKMIVLTILTNYLTKTSSHKKKIKFLFNIQNDHTKHFLVPRGVYSKVINNYVNINMLYYIFLNMFNG